jgi:hypothetical protein
MPDETPHNSLHTIAIGLFCLLFLAALTFWLAPSGLERAPLAIQSGESSEVIQERKAQILALASSNSALDQQTRDMIFVSLSGPKVLEYHFTPDETAKIIAVLNKSPQE